LKITERSMIQGHEHINNISLLFKVPKKQLYDALKKYEEGTSRFPLRRAAVK